MPEVELPPLESAGWMKGKWIRRRWIRVEIEEEVSFSEPDAELPPQRKVDFIALAAEAISAGRSLDDAEGLLIEQGMDEINAQQLVESMLKVAKRGKKSKAMLLSWIVVGLAFTGLLSFGAWWVQEKERPHGIGLYGDRLRGLLPAGFPHQSFTAHLELAADEAR